MTFGFDYTCPKCGEPIAFGEREDHDCEEGAAADDQEATPA